MVIELGVVVPGSTTAEEIVGLGPGEVDKTVTVLILAVTAELDIMEVVSEGLPTGAVIELVVVVVVVVVVVLGSTAANLTVIVGLGVNIIVVVIVVLTVTIGQEVVLVVGFIVDIIGLAEAVGVILEVISVVT